MECSAVMDDDLELNAIYAFYSKIYKSEHDYLTSLFKV